MLDLFVRYAYVIVYFLAIWFSIAYGLAAYRTPHEDTRRRQARGHTGGSTIIGIFLFMCHRHLRWHPPIYLEFSELLTIQGLLLAETIGCWWLIRNPAAAPDYHHPVDILLLRRPVRRVVTPQSEATGIDTRQRNRVALSQPERTREAARPGCMVRTLITIGVWLALLLPLYCIFFVVPQYIGPMVGLRVALGLLVGVSILGWLFLLLVAMWSAFRKRLATQPLHRILLDTPVTQPTAPSLSATLADNTPSPPAAAIVATIVGVLALTSVLGMGLQPCNWLDRLVQRSGCVHTLGDWWPQYLLTIAVAPDDSQLALSIPDEVQLLRMENGARLYTLVNPKYGESLDFSPDGTTLAAGGGFWDKQVRLWHTTDGSLVQTLKTDHWIFSMAFSHDGTLLATAGSDGSQLWRVVDGARIWSFESTGTGIAFSPDGRMLAVCDTKGINLWRVADLSMERTIGTPGDYLTFSPDGKLLAVAVQRRQITIWKVADGGLLHIVDWPTDREREPFDARVNSLAFSPDSALFAAGATDQTVRLWRTTDGALVRTLDQTAEVQKLIFTAQGDLAIGVKNGQIHIWRVQP